MRTTDVVVTTVKAEMARNDLKQRDVAAILGTTQTSVHRRLAGTVPFDADELRKLADAFGVSVGLFFGEVAA